MKPPSERPRRDTEKDVATPKDAEPSPTAETLSAKPNLDEGWQTLSSPTPAPAASGTPIALPLADPARFHFEDEIGRGGVGRVVRAIDRPLGRAVAIKQMLADAPELDARFYREMRLTARLQHPAIVPLYDAGRWPNGQPFYAMKLVEGRSLKELLARGGTQVERLALLPKLITVCDAIAYAHAQGVVHRDLKPANVLLGAFGETLVIDWGVAKDLRAGEEEPAPSKAVPAPDDGLTAAGMVVGTPAYMPPEQARGEEVDERADVYALGAILYELLSGRRPYKDSSSIEVLQAVIARAPQPVREMAPDAPPELLAIVEAAMARDRSARYANAAAMAEDLRRFETGQLVGAHRYPMRTLLRRWVARHRGAVQAALLFVLGGAIAGGISIRRVVVARDTARQAQTSAERALVAARDRQDQLILTQARTSVASDPTATLAWLKQLPADTHQLGAARELATSAYVRGYAEHAWRGAGAVSSVAYARDGQHVAAAFPGIILIADSHTGRAVRTPTTGDLDQITFAPEGSSLPPEVLLAPGPGGVIWLLGPDGKITDTLEGHTASVQTFGWSADGKTLVTGGADHGVRVWDLVKRQSRLVGTHAGAVNHLVVSPDGKRAATSSGGELIVWELAGGGRRSIQAGKHYTGLGRTFEEAGEYAALDFSPDGKTLGTLLTNDTTVQLWPVAGGGAEPIKFPEAATTLRFTPEGGLLVGAHSGKIYRWTRKHGKWNVLLEAANNQIEDIELVLRPGSTIPAIIAGASKDRTIELVRPIEDDRFELHGHSAGVTKARFSPDGTRLLSGSSDGTLRLWFLRAQFDQTLFTDGHNHAAAFSPDGAMIAFGTDDAVELQKVVASAQAGQAEERPIKLGGERVVAVAWAPGGKSVAASQESGVSVVGVDGVVRKLSKTKSAIVSLAYSDAGRRLAGADADGAVWVWDVESGRSWALATGGAAAGAPAIADGGDAIAVPMRDRTLVFSSRDPERAPWTISDGTAQVAAALSAAGDRLATGTSKGGVALWELPSRNRRALIAEEDGTAVLALALSRDGRLASLTVGRDLRYVDLASGRVDAAPHDEITLRGAQLSADLDHAVAWAGSDVWVWDRASFTWRSLPGWISEITDAAFSPDGAHAIVISGGESAERLDLGRSPVPRDGAGLRAWLDATTSTTIQANRPTTR